MKEGIKVDNTGVYNQLFRDYPDVVNVEQMCKILRIGKKTGYRLLEENEIEHFKIGRNYHIPKYHILKYLRIIKL